MTKENRIPVVAKSTLVVIVALLSGYIGGHLSVPRIQSPSPEHDTMAKIIQSKRLRFGYIVFPPSVSKGPSEDNPTGHMIDVARYIAGQIQVDAEFHETTWATFSAGLQAEQYDVVVAPLFATPSRASAVAFTEPLYYLGMAAIAKKGDTRFQTLNDLNGPNTHIAVNQGGANQRFAKEHFPNAQLTELSAEIAQVLSEVISGRADAAVADTWSVSKFAEQNSGTVEVLFDGKPLDVTATSWAVRPGDDRLLNFLDTSIEYLQTTGQMQVFEQKYGVHWLQLKREWAQD